MKIKLSYSQRMLIFDLIVVIGGFLFFFIKLELEFLPILGPQIFFIYGVDNFDINR